MKLFEICTSYISDAFYQVLGEGKKADWIATNQGEKLRAQVKKNNDGPMIGKSAQELADFIEKQGGKFAPFYSKSYLNGGIKRMEDFYRLKPQMELFLRNRVHLKNKDIMTYTIPSLRKALEPFQQRITNKSINPKEDKKHLDKGTMTRHIDTPNFETIVPHNEEAACHLGKDTKWCTAADKEHNEFSSHNKSGDLYVIRAGDRKFQLHYDTNQFMDEEDDPITKKDIDYLSEFPQYKDFLNTLIKKYYFDEKHHYPNKHRKEGEEVHEPK